MNTNNDNESPPFVEDLQLEFKPTAFGAVPCEICGAIGDVAVTRLPHDDLAVMAACALHWPPGAITPERWTEEELARSAARLTRLQLVTWLLSGNPAQETLQ